MEVMFSQSSGGTCVKFCSRFGVFSRPTVPIFGDPPEQGPYSVDFEEVTSGSTSPLSTSSTY